MENTICYSRKIDNGKDKDKVMAFLRIHLCYPFRAHFTCRIASFLTCHGCGFPGSWIQFGHVIKLHINRAARWLGIQVASLERNFKSSGFELIGVNEAKKTRTYLFPSSCGSNRIYERVIKIIYFIFLIFFQNKTNKITKKVHANYSNYARVVIKKNPFVFLAFTYL